MIGGQTTELATYLIASLAHYTGAESQKDHEKMKMNSSNLTQANIAKLAESFPNCITEVRIADGATHHAIDFDQLRQEHSGSILEGAVS